MAKRVHVIYVTSREETQEMIHFLCIFPDFYYHQCKVFKMYLLKVHRMYICISSYSLPSVPLVLLQATTPVEVEVRVVMVGVALPNLQDQPWSSGPKSPTSPGWCVVCPSPPVLQWSCSSNPMSSWYMSSEPSPASLK